MKLVARLDRRYWTLYPAWLLVCGLLFAGYSFSNDTGIPRNRIRQAEAGERAVAHLRQLDPVAYGRFEEVNTALANENDASPQPRWIVLCDLPERSALRQAVVVEIDARSGEALAVRSPVPGRKLAGAGAGRPE